MISSQEIQDIYGEVYGLGRGRKNLEHMIRLQSGDIDLSLSKLFAERVLSPFKQDVSLFIEGRKGAGKSYASLSIAYLTACEIAKRRGGTWENYFSVQKNIAIISPEDAYAVMQKLEDFNVYILDDIGVGWNARTFQKSENRMMNDIFEVCRVKRTVLIFSAPAAFLIDKVPRELATYRAEVAESIHEKGVVTLKLKTPMRISQLDKTISPYLTIGRNRIVRFVIPKPPDELAAQYDVLRADKTTQILESHAQDMADESEKKEVDVKDLEERAKCYEVIYHWKVNGLSLKESCKAVGTSDNTVRKFIKEYHLTI